MPRDSLLRRYRRFIRDDPDRDVDEELNFHLAMREDEFRRAGMSPDAAHAATLQRFGNLTAVHEECREMTEKRYARRRRSWKLQALRQDAHFALRTLRANPGYAISVALTMAIGIGANAAVFSVANGVILRPLPFREQERLVRLWSKNAPRSLEFFSVSPADYKTWRAQSRSFTAMGAFERQREASLARAGTLELVTTAAVTPDVFTVLGARAAIGRALLSADTANTAVAVLSHSLWATRFGGDSSIVGRPIDLDGRPYTVVGVMQPRFAIPGTPATVWTALSLANAPPEHGNRYLRVLGRLAPGVSVTAARQDLDLVAQRLGLEHPADNGQWSVNIMSIPEMVIGAPFRRSVLTLMAVVAMVLLIACANAANLQLARSVARGRELALRAALGASRGRLTLQLLTESMVLAVVAGVLGLALAAGGVKLLTAYGAAMVPRIDEVRLDGWVVAFTALVALGSGIVFGLWPALRTSRVSVTDSIKPGGRGVAGGERSGMRSSLVVVEVALSLMLLVAAGLLTKSFLRLQSVELGFDPNGLTIMPMRVTEVTYPDSQVGAFYDRLLASASVAPGVNAAAEVSSAPFAGPNAGLVFLPVEQQLPAGTQGPDADFRVVTPGYFRTMGIKVLRGRDFTPADRDITNDAVVISNTMAQRYWPGQDPIGHVIRIGDLIKGPLATIVGIVDDARYLALESPSVRPMLYFSAISHPQRGMMLVVRHAIDVQMAPTLRSLVSLVDARLPSPTATSMDALLSDATSSRRFALVLFGVFAIAALVLALVGLYGVLSYLVRLRGVEMGVRLALGASRRSLLASVMGSAMRLVAAGLIIGLVGAKLVMGAMKALLYGVQPTDALTYGAIALLLAFTGALASLMPAWRATRTDPIVALRQGG